jgi:hypothetical protein
MYPLQARIQEVPSNRAQVAYDNLPVQACISKAPSVGLAWTGYLHNAKIQLANYFWQERMRTAALAIECHVLRGKNNIKTHCFME